MRSFGLTDKGLVREHNEDHFYRSDNKVGNLPNLYVVADGMGGHNAGDIASKQAVAYMIDYIEKAKDTDVTVLMTDAVLHANEQVFLEGQENSSYKGMGTTLVACSIVESKLYVVNVGDSRLYKLSSALEQVTVDHSIVEELYRAGQITEQDKMTHPDRNVITRAIGAEGAVAVDHFTVDLSAEDLIVMCSDGLNKMMVNEEIERLIDKHDDLEAAAGALVEGAKALGGRDNITVILVDTEGGVQA